MAAVTATVGTTNDTSNGTSYISASFTPTVGDLLVVVVNSTGSVAAAPTLTASANGITFTLGSTTGAYGVGGIHTLYVFVANQLVGASPAAMTVTFDCTADASTGVVLFTAAVSGMTKTGSAAIRQMAAESAQVSPNVPTVTFGSACLTGNPVIGCTGQVSVTNAVQPSGWTEQGELTIATPTAGFEYASIDSGFTSATVTWGANSAGNHGSLALELDASGSGSTATPQYQPGGLTWRRLFARRQWLAAAPLGAVAATATGSLALDGTAAAAAPVTATGSLTLGGAAAWVVPAVTGSLTLGGAAAWTPSASGSLTLAGTAATAAPATATGSLTLDGTAAAAAAVTATGAITLGGAADATAAAAFAPLQQPGGLTWRRQFRHPQQLAAVPTTQQVAATATGSLTLAGAVTAQVAAAAAGSVTLGATTTWSVTTVTGSLTLGGTAAWSVTAVTGSLILGGTATWSVTSVTGSITLAGTTAWTPLANGSLTLAATAAWRLAALAGSLNLFGSANARAPATVAGSLTLLAAAAWALLAGVTGALTLSAAATATSGGGITFDPQAGTTVRPAAGVTARTAGTTGRPTNGITPDPDMGITTRP